MVGLVATLLLVRRGDRVHRVVLWLWGIQTVYAAILIGTAVAGAHGGTAGIVNSPNPSLAAASYGRSMLDRLAPSPAHTPARLPFLRILWPGFWAGPRPVVQDPAPPRPPLAPPLA